MLASVLWLKAALNFFMNRISIILGSRPRLVVQINRGFGDRLRLLQKGYDRNLSLKCRLTGTTWRGRRFGTILVSPVFVKASIHTLIWHSNVKNSVAICVLLVERYQKHIYCLNNAVCTIVCDILVQLTFNVIWDEVLSALQARFSAPGFDPRTVQPVVCRYTDWAIPAQISFKYHSDIRRYMQYPELIKQASLNEWHMHTVVPVHISSGCYPTPIGK